MTRAAARFGAPAAAAALGVVRGGVLIFNPGHGAAATAYSRIDSHREFLVYQAISIAIVPLKYRFLFLDRECVVPL